MSFKANIDNFAQPDDQDEEDDDEDVIKMGGDEDESEGEAKKDGVYRPPKLAPVYNGN